MAIYTIQLKRGQSSNWETLNPVLGPGEPGYELDTHKIKIGDGVTAWNDLPYIGEHNIINYNTHYDFPAIGNENYIYKAKKESLLYQWDDEKFIYTALGANIIDEELDFIDGGSAEMSDEIDNVISGGGADGDY